MTSQPDPLVKVAYYRKRLLSAVSIEEAKPIVRLYNIWLNRAQEMKPEERCGHE